MKRRYTWILTSVTGFLVLALTTPGLTAADVSPFPVPPVPLPSPLSCTSAIQTCVQTVTSDVGTTLGHTLDTVVGLTENTPSTPDCGAKSPENYHDGYANASDDPNQWEGAGARIVVWKGLVCDSDSSIANFTTAWVMVADNSGTGWMQSGYWRSWGDYNYHFAQDMRDRFDAQNCSASSNYNFCTKVCKTSSQCPGAYGPLDDASEFLYWEQTLLVNGEWRLRGNVETVNILQTAWSPFQYWSPPFQVSWSGEAPYRESNIPGTVDSKTRFSEMEVQNYWDGTWGTQLPNLYSALDAVSAHRWALSPIRQDANGVKVFDIWTKG